MGIEELKQEIIDQTNRQCNEILAKAKLSISRMEKEFEQKKKEVQKAFDNDVQKQLDEMRRRHISSAEIEGKNSLFKAKKEAVEGLFRESEKELSALPKEERRKILASLVRSASAELEIKKVYCSKQDKDIVREILKLKKSESEADVEVSEENISGGILSENSEGNVRIDFSYESMLGDFKEKNMEEIGKILFG